MALHGFLKLFMVHWMHQPLTQQREPFYLQVFSGATLLLFAFSFLSSYLLGVLILQLGNRLHSQMICRVAEAPSSFFWSHSLGHIINRFAKDQAVLDNTLPYRVVTFAIVSVFLS